MTQFARVPPKAADTVYEQLRGAILSGTLKPATRLRQAELAASMGVSLIPVREALNRLAADGLVMTQPRLGVYVAALSLADARELYAMRAALEPLALRHAAANGGPGDWATARRLLAELDPIDDPARYAQLNTAFHFALYEPCAMPRLLISIQRIWDGAMRYSSLWMQTQPSIASSQKEHRAILSALESGNCAQAAAILDSHISNAGARVCGLIAAHEEDRSADS